MRMFNLLAIGALAVPALASDVYVGSNTGEVLRYGPQGTSTIFPTLCGPIESLASNGRTLYVGDSLGNIFTVQTSAGNAINLPFALPAAPNSLVYASGALLAGSADGTIRRVNPDTGQVLASWQVQSTLDAMVAAGDVVYAGGHNTLIYRGSATTGNFTMLSACFGQVNSLAIIGTELIAGGLDGRVYRFNAATGQFLGQYQMASTNHTTMGADGPHLWTMDLLGSIKRINPDTGAVLSTVPISAEITGLAVLPTCIPDFNGDAFLNVQDFAAFLNAFAARDLRADIDQSGRLNILDFGRFLNLYAAGCP